MDEAPEADSAEDDGATAVEQDAVLGMPAHGAREDHAHRRNRMDDALGVAARLRQQELASAGHAREAAKEGKRSARPGSKRGHRRCVG